MVQVAHAHHHLFQGGIASTLAQAVDRGVGMGGTGAQGRQRIGAGQPKVVVGVDFDLDVHRLAQPRHRFKSGERVQHTERVGKTDPAGTTGLGPPGHQRQKAGIGA